MNQLSIHSRTMVTVFLILCVQFQILSTGFHMFGQAQPNETWKKPSVEHQRVEMVVGDTLVHPLEVAKEEKFLLDNTASSRLLEIKSQTQREHREFVKAVQTTDVTRLDLRKPSGISVGQADLILKGTGLEGLGKAFVEAEKKHQVNAYYLIAHAAWESAWGKSNISKEKNNLYGFMAYDHSPYKSAKAFKSKAESIDVVAGFIKKHYLDEDGKYYHGPTLRGMNVRYASDDNWGRGIGKVILYLVNKSDNIEGPVA